MEDSSLTIYSPVINSLAIPDISPLANNPSPLTIEEQMAAVNQQPDAEAVRDDQNLGFKYLTIGYVSRELNLIFGPGNVAPVELSDYVKYHDQGESTLILCRIHLLVRWASGSIQAFPGIGEGRYWKKNPRARIDASEGIALSEAIKNAARRIGTRFGMALADEIKEGLLENLQVNSDKEQIAASVGERVYYSSKEKKNLVMTSESLSIMSEHYGGGELDSLDAKSLRVLAAIITDLPLKSDWAQLKRKAKELDISFTEETKWSDLREAVNKAVSDKSGGLI